MKISLLLSGAAICALATPATAQTGADEDDLLFADEIAPIVITASIAPVSALDAASSLTLIEPWTIDALDLTQAVDLLRLAPGVTIAQSGPDGSQTQVRLRGAEANHTLVIVDGIEANDAGSSNEFRWEYLPAAGIEAIEVLRGPASSLHGSEALGGVIAVDTLAPYGNGGFAAGSYGSADTLDVSSGARIGGEAAGLALLAAYVRSDGIDSFAGGPQEKDGFDNLSLSARGRLEPSDLGRIDLTVRYADSEAHFDGTDPVTFQRADTLDSTTSRRFAVGFRAEIEPGEDWTHRLDGSWLDTGNRNFRAGASLNRVDASTFRAGYQTSYGFDGAGVRHTLTGRAEFRAQDYDTRDREFFGLTDQKQDRARHSLAGEYRVSSDSFVLAASIRQDWNESFEDATTWRAAGRVRVSGGLHFRASAGEAFAVPTFTEQFGFFPGSFVGNPDLRPERSFGWEVGVDAEVGILDVGATWFQADLEDEILTTFDSTTFLSGVANADGESERRGIEVFASTQLATLDISASYTWLDADEVRTAGALPVREVRRPEHSVNLTATADLRPLTLGLSLSYVGERRDIDFDSFPSRDVTLGDYVLGTLSAAYAVTDDIELTARAENLFDAEYQDVFGYTTQGLSGHVGVRWTWGD